MGGADLVAHGGEELRFRTVGLFGIFLGCHEFARAGGDILLELLALPAEARITLSRSRRSWC